MLLLLLFFFNCANTTREVLREAFFVRKKAFHFICLWVFGELEKEQCTVAGHLDQEVHI